MAKKCCRLSGNVLLTLTYGDNLQLKHIQPPYYCCVISCNLCLQCEHGDSSVRVGVQKMS